MTEWLITIYTVWVWWLSSVVVLNLRPEMLTVRGQFDPTVKIGSQDVSALQRI